MVVVLGRFGDGRFCSCGDDRCGRCISFGRLVWWLWYIGMVVVVHMCGGCAR